MLNKYEKEVMQIALDNEKEILNNLKKNYKDALDEIESRIANLMVRDDADMQHVIYQVEYQKALKNQILSALEVLQYNNFETISEYLTQSYETGFIGTLYELQAQGIPLIFPIDQKQVVAAIQHETKLSESLYNTLGKDTKVLSKKIASEISRGISNGATVSEMARNISGHARIPQNNAMRIARTEAHRIQEKATSNAQWKAKERGADIVKIWDASLDGKTRDTHRKLDGQIRELDEPFEVGGMKAMEPGGFGMPEMDVNCRCRSRSDARWALGAEETKMLGNTSEMDNKTKKSIAGKLGIPVDDLDKYSGQIVPVKAKNYEDFKKQYDKIYNYRNSDEYKQAQEKIAGYAKGKGEERVRSSVQKMKTEFVPAKTVEEAEESTKNILADAYEYHRTRNNLNATPYQEGFVSVNYGKIDEKCASAFDSTFADLTSKYDTTLQSIRTMTKDEYLYKKDSFAFTFHDYDVDKSTLVINPAKFKDYDSYVERMKELMSNGYAVNVGADNAGKYIATHEFAHTLIDTGSTLDKKRNWLGADYKKIQSARNEIEGIYSEYLYSVKYLTEKQNAAELEALETFNDEAWKNAQSLSKQLSNVRISRYSLESADEFMAEAFTAEQFGVGNEWSKKVADVIDSYFKK